MSAIKWVVFAPVVVLAIGYPLLDLIAPGVAIRWQMAATRRHSAQGAGAPGRAFQEAFGVTNSPDPEHDPAIRRRVRILGVGLLAVGLALVWVIGTVLARL